MTDIMAGSLEVGTDGAGNVIVNHSMTHVDEKGNGHFVFSCRQARDFAIVLLHQARLAAAEERTRENIITETTR